MSRGLSADTVEKLGQVILVLNEGAIAERKFSLNGWGYTTSVRPTRKGQACNTTACACGYAALDPWFQERGLYVVPGFIDEWDSRIRSVDHFQREMKKRGHFSLGMRYRKEEGRSPSWSWEAIEEFFGLTERQAKHLFSDTYYPPGADADTVLLRIGRFIEANGRLVK